MRFENGFCMLRETAFSPASRFQTGSWSSMGRQTALHRCLDGCRGLMRSASDRMHELVLRLGHALDLHRASRNGKPPEWKTWTFSEKILWRCENPDPKVDYAIWADKYEAKRFVGHMFDVAETFSAVRDIADLTTEGLPDAFIMKATNGWNMNLLVEDGLVRGTNTKTDDAGQPADAAYLRQVAEDWSNSFSMRSLLKRQKHYRQITPGVLFEERLAPIDYELQLFLFEGRLRYATVVFRDFHFHLTKVRHRSYDRHWQCLAPGSDEAAELYETSEKIIPRPPAKLLKDLKTLCRAIDHVRADFLVCGGKYYFCEFTFTHNGVNGPGLIGKYDAELGAFWLS